MFNSLNVLYTLVRKKSREAPEAIIKLSDILRYVLYETNEEFVPLHKEIKLIRDYIDLQKYRSEVTVDFKEQVDDDNVQIIPMLLLPILENAYKHGSKSSGEIPVISIHIISTENSFSYAVTNSKSKDGSNTIDQHSGIGLENIRKRLDHYFKGHYEFRIEEEGALFSVYLEIKVNQP